MQKNDILTLKFVKKRLVRKPSEKVVIGAFQGDKNMLKNKNEFKSDE